MREHTAVCGRSWSAEAAGTALLVGAILLAAAAHLNPAVTLGFWALGRMGRRDVAGHVAAQALALGWLWRTV